MALAPRVTLWYLRALGLVYFVSGLAHWAFIVGVTGDGFAEAATHVQAAVVYLAILEVIAAAGLWSGAAWGVAAWLFAAVAEMVMHGGFAELFGADWPKLAFHAATILAYVGLAWWSGAREPSKEVFHLPPD